MFMKPIGKLVLAGFAATVLGMPTPVHACGFFDWLCGRPQATPVAQTTYAPRYVAPAVTTCASPVAVCASPAVTCASPVTACSPQTCYYVPETHYQILNRPILTALFGPRAVPVTTYRLECSMNCAPVTSCAPIASVGVPGCPSGNCAPSLPAAQTYVAPGPATYSAPESSASENVVPQTFVQPDLRPEPTHQETQKASSSATEEPASTPGAGTQFNSMPAPRLIDPDNRTTSRPFETFERTRSVTIRQAAYQPPVAAHPAPTLIEVQWQPSTR